MKPEFHRRERTLIQEISVLGAHGQNLEGDNPGCCCA